VAMLANEDGALRTRLEAFRSRQTEAARAMSLPPDPATGSSDTKGRGR
jgi:5-(carboxyamino)imidazole ribonucleotide mutase